MKYDGDNKKKRSNSALALAAVCAVAFMLSATIVSVVLFHRNMAEASELLADAKYQEYDSYLVLIASDDKSDFWQQVFQGARDYGEEHGIYVDMISDNVNIVYTKQELFEMAIASGCDAILMEGDDSPETKQLLDKAKDEGISVITLQSDVDSADRVSYISVNNYSIATLYAKELIDDLAYKKQVMVIAGADRDSGDVQSFVTNVQEALINSLNGESVPEFLVKQVENNETFATEEYVQNLFKDNEVTPVIICLDEVSTTCVYQAMVDYNMVGQIKLYGFYQSDTILTGIKQKVIDSSVTVDAIGMGQAAVDAFIEYRDTGYVSDYINVNPGVINFENVDDYLVEVDDGDN
ncbi:MAG: substrate-binding domain-containing protein [Pseudobutyrivibrio sp.]|nr:substrate-binding domain-containing protein [Pseudobutyrivibrio sp.]